MKKIAALVAMCACCVASGCAPAMTRMPPGASQAHATPRSAPAFARPTDDARAASARPDAARETRSLAAGRNSKLDKPSDGFGYVPKSNAGRSRPAVQLAAHAEAIATPRSNASLESVTTADDISDPDALTRRVGDVQVDIRPPKGELPTDLAAAALSRDARAELAKGPCGREEMVVGWTPWTLCYRPLYLEDIPLERYGSSAGCLQPGLSAAKFFFGVGLLPYKTFAQKPRACVCSNGFSRCGDPMPPGYKDCRIHLDGAVFEAGVLTGIVLALP